MFDTKADSKKDDETAPRRYRGSAAVEFAIILPVLVVLLFGIVEFGLALYDKAVITNASREAARAGIVYSDPPVSDGEITAVVNNYCLDNLVTFGTDHDVTTTVTRDGTSTGDDLTVTVAFKYDYLVLPAFISSLTGGLNLSATTVMRME